MGEFGISGLIKDGELERLEQCDVKLLKIKKTYMEVAEELAKGLKMEIETPKSLISCLHYMRLRPKKLRKLMFS